MPILRTHVDLFSGIGGFALACRWVGVETIAFAETDSYASRVLQRHSPNVRNYGDVRDVPAMRSVWLVSGGVPCQPASVAGKRRGAADDRWLWPEALTVVDRIRPAWVLFENPCGILSLNDGLEFERICAALEDQGYEIQPLIIPACAVGAPHRRDRVWIIAHANEQRGDDASPTRRYDGNLPRQHGEAQTTDANGTVCKHGSSQDDVASSTNNRTERIQTVWQEAVSWIGRFQRGEDERRVENERVRLNIPKPLIRRNGDGVSAELDERIKCLGNAIVPQVAYQLIKRMIEAEEQSHDH